MRLIISSSNLLYAQEDRQRSELNFVCKACNSVQQFDNKCTYRNRLGASIASTAGVVTDVSNDPTVGDDLFFCTMCGAVVKCSKCNKDFGDGEDEEEDHDPTDNVLTLEAQT